MAIDHAIRDGHITFREFPLLGSKNEAAIDQDHSFDIVEDVWEDASVRRICFWVCDIEIWTYRFSGLDLGDMTDADGDSSCVLELLEIVKSRVPSIDLAWRIGRKQGGGVIS
ncbi:MAG: hypothetical protein IH830_03795 [Planctomycetes bacterium]|nr:hypothetical protein [Planctomycetota bacterium]